MRLKSFSLTFIVSLTLLLDSSLLAMTDQKKDPPQGLGISHSDPLELMIEKIPDFENRVKTCQKPERRASFNDCLWDGDAALDLGALPEEEKKAIKGYLQYKKNEQGERPEVGNSPLQMTEYVTTQKDPAIKSLEDYFSKKLRQALYGDVKNDLASEVGNEINEKKHKVVDQRAFHDIYENLISKKVVSDISSYCIRVDYKIFEQDQDGKLVGPYVIVDPDSPEKTAQVIKDNKDRLASGAKEHSALWKKCFVDIQNICYEAEEYCNNMMSQAMQKSCKERISKSQTKACTVMRSVRASRQALIANKDIIEGYEDPERISGSIALAHSNTEQVEEISTYDPNQEEVSPDKITTFSSGEILSKENDFSATHEKQLERMEECYDKDAGKIVDAKACEDFLASNREEQYRAVAEVSARSRAVSQQIEEIKEEDDIRGFLEQEGRSKDEIDALIEAYGGDIAGLRAEINNKYQQEQEALIKEMSSLVNQTTTQSSDGIDPDKDLGTIQKIHKELTEKEDVFKQTVHYNNVMASFLTINDSDGEEIGRNTGAVIAEMKNSAFNPELDEERNQAYFDQLTAELEKTKSLEKNDSESTNILLDVSKINEQLLRYSRQPAKEDEKK